MVSNQSAADNDENGPARSSVVSVVNADQQAPETGQPMRTPGQKEAAGSGTSSRRAKGVAKQFLRGYLVVLLVPALFIAFTVGAPGHFLAAANLRSMLTTNSPLLILAVGMTVVLACGEFDLSFYGVIGMSAGIVAGVPQLSLWGALAVSLGAAVLAGLVNSFFVVVLNVSAFIATLGMGVLTLGIALGATHSETLPNPFGGITSVFAGTFLGISYSFYIALAAVALLWGFLEHTVAGRNLYFTGANRKAAAYAGVNVNKVRVGALVVSAITGWIAGLFILAESGAVVAGYGSGYLLTDFAAVFLGYAAIRPGKYNALGTLVGVAVLAVGTTGLEVMAAPLWITDVFTGAILFVGVAAANILGRAGSFRELRSAVR